MGNEVGGSMEMDEPIMTSTIQSVDWDIVPEVEGPQKRVQSEWGMCEDEQKKLTELWRESHRKP